MREGETFTRQEWVDNSMTRMISIRDNVLCYLSGTKHGVADLGYRDILADDWRGVAEYFKYVEGDTCPLYDAIEKLTRSSDCVFKFDNPDLQTGGYIALLDGKFVIYNDDHVVVGEFNEMINSGTILENVTLYKYSLVREVDK